MKSNDLLRLDEHTFELMCGYYLAVDNALVIHKRAAISALISFVSLATYYLLNSFLGFPSLPHLLVIFTNVIIWLSVFAAIIVAAFHLFAARRDEARAKKINSILIDQGIDIGSIPRSVFYAVLEDRVHKQLGIRDR